MSLLVPTTASEIAQVRGVIDAKLRSSLATFIHRTFQTVAPGKDFQNNWHIQAIAWYLERCLGGGTKRLMINLPPRYLKSICASVAFPAWVLGHDPSTRIICASYSENLASKHSLDCRSVIESSWYHRAFAQTRLSPRKNTALNFETTALGYRYATSVGGSLTGRGGNIIIIDDPLKPDDAMSESRRSDVNDWFYSTLYSRLDSKLDDVIILIMQRLHVEDLAGYVLQKEPWVQLNLPAIAEVDEDISLSANSTHHRQFGDLLHPEREPLAVLDQLKSNLGSFTFSAQYQQNPMSPQGAMIKWDWFRIYDHLPALGSSTRVVQSWDTASKAGELNDYSVCTTWLVKGKDYYLLDVLRDRLNYPDLRREIINQAQAHVAREIIIEDKGSGTSLIQDLSHESGIPRPIAFTPEGDKITRMSAQSSRIEAGQVHLPRKAPWLDDLRAELLQFPYGKNDDQVDSLSQFLTWVERSPGNRWSVQPLML